LLTRDEARDFYGKNLMCNPKGQRLSLTKIDAAEAQLKAAVRMYFENDHLAPICTLANAVREMVAQIGKHLDVETVQKEIAAARGMKVEEMIRPLSKTANFFKHADRRASWSRERSHPADMRIVQEAQALGLIVEEQDAACADGRDR
jgi:hypothetical protein